MEFLMIQNRKIFFSLFSDSFHDLEENDLDNVVVITFFGKSVADFNGCKFDGFKGFKRKEISDPFVPEIDGLYDAERKVIYLQLRGVLDVQVFMNTISQCHTELNEKGYLSIWADLKIAYAKSLFFLSTISNIMVLCHPVAVFDRSYLQLFRALDVAREETRGECAKAISDLNMHFDWRENGRISSPRLLFRFMTPPSEVDDVRQLEHSLEDQIYILLKEHQLVLNNCGSSLFSIPVNQEFVFVETNVNRPGGRLIKCVQNIVEECIRTPALTSSHTPFNFNYLSVNFDLQQSETIHKFDNFLTSHIDVALSKGLEEAVSRHSHKTTCYLPTPKKWAKIAKALHSCILKEEVDKKCLNALRGCLDIDRKFSEGRCAKVLPIAFAAYQEGAPPHYPRTYHDTKLAHALSVLATHGRGAMLDKYVSLLERQCCEHWRNGRQMCEVLSLTGHPCVNALHRGGGEGAGGGELLEDKEEKKNWDVSEDRKLEALEEKEHCSGIRYFCACNCGRKQGHRPDPYTLRAANFEFYRSLGVECGCEKFETFKFPVFQPSVKDFRAAQLLGRRESLALLRGDHPRSQLGGGTQQEVFSLAFVSGPSVQGSCDVVETRLSCLRTQHPDILILTNQPGDPLKDKGLVRQASTTEYLPGMLHTESPTGLLPQFASWSLKCAGASSVYSHNLGLNDQPGLLPGSSYLLPWDVTVRLEHQRKNVWPSVSDSKRGGSQLRLRKTKGEQSEMVVKIFVGVEYECTRGHRFMAAGPDKVLKTGPTGQVRDTGHKVASSDMPLYFSCPCSKPNKPTVAQLIRLHVVTPKAPVKVTLNPRVQPAPNAPIFIACQDQPISLTQSTYWILRLPYVYMSERSPFVAPLEIPGPMYGKLLGGSFGIAEIPPEKS